MPELVLTLREFKLTMHTDPVLDENNDIPDDTIRLYFQDDYYIDVQPKKHEATKYTVPGPVSEEVFYDYDKAVAYLYTNIFLEDGIIPTLISR